MLIKRTKCRLTGESINASFWAHLPGIALIPDREHRRRLWPLMKERENVFIFLHGDRA